MAIKRMTKLMEDLASGDQTVVAASATTAGHAGTASVATLATSAGHAGTASVADYATSAGYASTAGTTSG